MTKLDALTLLKNDHADVKAALAALEATGAGEVKERTRLAAEAVRAIELHARIEEELFYPAFRDALSEASDEELYFTALEEHHVVELVIPDLLDCDPESGEFLAKVRVLRDLVERHVDEEERELFPRVRKLLGAERLAEIAESLASRKEELAEAVRG